MNPEIVVPELELRNEITETYPQLILPPPLDLETFENIVIPGAEQEFAHIMMCEGHSVFYQPVIKACNYTPDFLIFNHRVEVPEYRGKLVEITLMPKTPGRKISKKTRLRKQRQRKAIELTGIPYAFLYREELLRIGDNYGVDFFGSN